MPAKKNSQKKTVKKTAAKKTVAKKTATKAAPKKAADTSKTSSGKKAVKKATGTKTAKPSTTMKQAENNKKDSTKTDVMDSKTKELVLNARKRTVTPSVFKQRKGKNTPVVFTMEDVEEMLKNRKGGDDKKTAPSKAQPKKKAEPIIEEEVQAAPRNHAAASLSDILGFNPAEKAAAQSSDNVPQKFMKYYKALQELRDHVNDGLQLHTADTLKRSNKEDSGDLSGYGQHMADAGTDTFDRDFALSLVSSEQEALYEIEEAIQRIFNGTYGTCEITGEPIAKDRLMAVPFTRYSLEGQRELKKQRRSKIQRVGVLNEDSDDAMSFTDDDGDN
ncbi:MAG: TraR/DksA family transcriptional regulator [Puniceicoccales bacterium]